MVLFVIAMTGYVSFLLYAFTSALADSEAVAGVVLFLVVLPILLLVSIIYVRVVLEIEIVLFRISENTSEMVHQMHTLSNHRASPPREPPTTEEMPGQQGE